MIFQWQLNKNWQKSKEMPCKFLGFFPVSSLAWLIKKSWDRKYQVNKFYRFPRKNFFADFFIPSAKKNILSTQLYLSLYKNNYFLHWNLACIDVINFNSETSEKLHKSIFLSQNSSYFLSIKKRYLARSFLTSCRKKKIFIQTPTTFWKAMFNFNALQKRHG